MNEIGKVAEHYTALQSEICRTLEKADGKAKFEAHPWKKEIGNGISSVLQNEYH